MPNDIEFDDNWSGSGYEVTYPELLETIKWAAKTEGLILDPTYTGKAFHALKMYVKNEVIKPNANVVFWHTGGLLNLMATHKI
jgi:1-aminocyclopropane-1-carboxylate deaminase/D-cysteine desulfhydrase-like pyridoxal-dependent ACC family enzyme